MSTTHTYTIKDQIDDVAYAYTLSRDERTAGKPIESYDAFKAYWLKEFTSDFMPTSEALAGFVKLLGVDYCISCGTHDRGAIADDGECFECIDGKGSFGPDKDRD